MKTEEKKYRIYHITDDYDVECFDFEKDDGKWTNYYISQEGGYKFDCFAEHTRSAEDELEMVKYVFYEYLPDMRQELDDLEDLFWKRIHEAEKDDK